MSWTEVDVPVSILRKVCNLRTKRTSMLSGVTAIGVIGFALSFAISPVAQAATRRCDAAFEWYYAGSSPSGRSRPIRFGQFTASGTCGKSVPNRCRKRAKEAARKCMLSHAERGSRKPESCLYGHSVEGYAFDNLSDDLRREVCRGTALTRLRVDVWAVTWGDKHCDSRTPVLNSIQVYCPENRRKEE